MGGIGSDTLRGGNGFDVLNGGRGVDTFVFTSNDGSDIIEDFQDGTDILQVSVGNFDALDISNGADGAVIDYGTGTVELTGVNANLLDADDFLFE